MGRWTAKEPLGFLDGNNLYLYCHNNPILYCDINGLWTFQVGVSGTAGASTGVTASAGIAISYSEESGFQIGGYTLYGGGSYVGVGASASLDFTWSGNSTIDNLNGLTLTIGGSQGSTGPLGGEINFPDPDDCIEPSISVPGSTPEGHAFGVHTDVFNWTQSIQDWAHSVDQGMNQAFNNILNSIIGPGRGR